MASHTGNLAVTVLDDQLLGTDYGFHSSSVTCPQGLYSCTITLQGKSISSSTKIYGGGGDLAIDASGFTSFHLAEVHCPISRVCNVTCSGFQACHDTTINATLASTLNLKAP
eukprot:22318_1